MFIGLEPEIKLNWTSWRWAAATICPANACKWWNDKYVYG